MGVDAPSVSARPVPALIDVDLAGGPVETLVAVAAVPFVQGHAVPVEARVTRAMVLLGTVDTFPSDRTRARVVGQRLEGASPSVLARTGVASIFRNGDLAEAGRVADGAGALELRTAGRGHQDVAGPAVLAFLAAGVAGVLVLAVFADVVGWTAGRNGIR